MKLITAADLISIGISPDKIIEFNSSPVMLLNDSILLASSYLVDKLEDVLTWDWVNDINKGDAGLFLIYANKEYEDIDNKNREQFKIPESSKFILRIFKEDEPFNEEE